MCTERGFHHKGSCRGELAVACRGPGASKEVPECERIRVGIIVRGFLD